MRRVNSKKIIYFGVGSILLFNLTYSSPVRGEQIPTLTIASDKGNFGEIATLPVYAKYFGDSSVGSVTLYLEYDNEALQYQNLEFMKLSSATMNSTASGLVVLWYDSSAQKPLLFKEDDTLLTLRFKIISKDGKTIKVNFSTERPSIVGNNLGTAIKTDLINGEIVINGGTQKISPIVPAKPETTTTPSKTDVVQNTAQDIKPIIIQLNENSGSGGTTNFSGQKPKIADKPVLVSPPQVPSKKENSTVSKPITNIFTGTKQTSPIKTNLTTSTAKNNEDKPIKNINEVKSYTRNKVEYVQSRIKETISNFLSRFFKK